MSSLSSTTFNVYLNAASRAVLNSRRRRRLEKFKLPGVSILSPFVSHSEIGPTPLKAIDGRERCRAVERICFSSPGASRVAALRKSWASTSPFLTTIPVAGGRQSRGIERANITYEIAPDLGHWGVDIVGKVKAWAKAIIGPTSPPGKYPQLMNAPGSETGPGPQLVTWGKSTILSVDAHGFKFEYMLNSAKHIPFDWVGP